MPLHQLLAFRCERCSRVVHVDVTEDQEVGDHWPANWLIIKAGLVGTEEEDEKIFCPEHAVPVVKALGYSDLATMAAALEAEADARANEEEMKQVRAMLKAHGNLIELDDEIIVIDDDDN